MRIVRPEVTVIIVHRPFAADLTAQDLLNLTPKFWALHTDPIWTMDGAACTLVTLQYNCCAGTLAKFVHEQPCHRALLQQILAYDVSGLFCLTEVGHGLDAIHLDTTVTVLPDGGLELHTPHDQAAKYMPPTTPVGMPCVAIVFARLLVDGGDRGIRPFVVPIHDGKVPVKGVTIKSLPHRGGSRPLNHALTYFNRVKLPFSSLLGSTNVPADVKKAFFENISRVIVGTIALGSLSIPALRVASTIAARYSLRRTIVDNMGASRSILHFRTQKTPIMTAIAQSYAIQALYTWATPRFSDTTLDPRVRHAIAAILKITAIRLAQDANLTLSERCGAQGLFEVNQLSGMFADMRGSAIAEGDLLALAIRLASELLLNRYAVPSATLPNSLLSRHEAGLFSELRAELGAMSHHRSAHFDRLILPHCMNLIQSIGHRMAYEAAVADGVDQCLVDLFVATSVKLDIAWYIENTELSRAALNEMECSAVDLVFDGMNTFLGRMQVEEYISAPIISNSHWKRYTDNLEAHL